MQIEENKQLLIEFDLFTNQAQTLFSVPDNGWVADFAAVPQTSAWVLSYAPPPPAGEIQFGYTALYLFDPSQEPELRLLTPVPADQELYFNPTWDYEGERLAYSHVSPLNSEEFSFSTDLEMLDLVVGTVTVLAKDGIWPVFAPDGRSLAFVHVDPQTQANALHHLDLFSMEVRTLLPGGSFTAIDAPFFSPDGEWIYFSAVSDLAGSQLPWWQQLGGLKTVVAHDLPSDWWRLPAAGGPAQRLTELNAVGLAGRFTIPETIMFVQREGLFKMAPDGSQLQLLRAGNLLDSFSWRP